jgi:signal transduction histidine kinase
MQARNVGRSLSTRLILAFLLVAIPAVAFVGAISFYALRDLTTANRDLQEISRSLEAVRALEGSVGQALMPVSRFVAYGASGQDRVFESLMGEIESRLQGCGATACHGASAQPQEMAQGLVPHFRGIKARAANVFGEDTGAAERIRLFREITEQGREVNRQLEHMSSALLVRVESLQQNSQDVYERASSLILGAIFMVAGLAVLIAYFISRQLARPIRELVAGTRHIMQGNVDHRVKVNESGEIGELARSFNAMAQEIGEHRGRLESLVLARTAELEQAHASLIRSEKLSSIGVLASGVAHELNNPLTSILMNIDLLMEDVEDRPDLHRELKRVSADALRCQRIINDLRDFSRRRELEIVPCDLNAVVCDVLGLISRQLRLQKIALTRDLFDPMPSVSCDPDRMRQVLMNIFVNAIQAMPEGGALSVETALQDGYAAITVADCGPGISADIRSRIFDPFFTTKVEGTGLGLSIVYGIMEEHGGKVEIESVTAGRAGTAPGTVVRLLLPTTNGRTGREHVAAAHVRAKG